MSRAPRKPAATKIVPTNDELAELIDGHMALDRLGVSRFAVDIEMTIGRRINLLVHEMEEAAKKSVGADKPAGTVPKKRRLRR